MKSLLILNPTSGQGRAERGKRALLDLFANSPCVDVKITTSADDAFVFANEAICRKYDSILVAGGDGTINKVINGIGPYKIPIGIIPLGTANVLANYIGINPHKIYEAIAVIFAGKTHKFDICRAGNQYFFLNAGFGLDAEVIDSVSPKSKELVGPVAFARPALQTIIKSNPSTFTLTFDNGENYKTDAYFIIAANCAHYANNVNIAPQAIFDDGYLDLLVFEAAWDTKLKLLGHTLEAVFQQRIKDLEATYFKVKKVRIDSEPRVKMQLDGDVCGESCVDIEVLPKAVTFFVP